MENILELRDITVVYSKDLLKKKAVDRLSFSINYGEIYGFLGPNGAGKTTTIKTMLGLLLPTEGQVSLFQKPPSLLSTRKRVGYMPEIANYYWYLTPREILLFYGSLFNIKPSILQSRTEELLELVDLKDYENRLLGTFSKGMLQKVSFAQSLINDPELLVLDEPTTGLDPIAKMDMRDTLLRLKRKGKTIFFSSHELSEVEIISDRVAILKNGKILKEAHPKELIDEKGEHISLEKYFFEIIKK